ncbi:hypothetical protein CUMW_161800 [Citrus unshiu]|uniref:Uncharacterized protein n=1 Tax=Citrus unshiu TaxID=55188 RepID=A0A2H5PRX2_CITUN|nr:hypothetical protein CUMW_161800 [Citrus unshiu]
MANISISSLSPSPTSTSKSFAQVVEVVQNQSSDEVIEKALGCNKASSLQSSTNLAIVVHKAPLLMDTTLRQFEIDLLTLETYRPDDDDFSQDDQ